MTNLDEARQVLKFLEILDYRGRWTSANKLPNIPESAIQMLIANHSIQSHTFSNEAWYKYDDTFIHQQIQHLLALLDFHGE